MAHPSTCKDCNSLLDAFGICPNADPKDAAIMTAPVNCGRRPTLDAEGAMALVRAIHPERCDACLDAHHYARMAHIDYAEAYRMNRAAGMNEALIESAYINRAMAIQLGADAQAIDDRFAAVRGRLAQRAVA